jgi:hypothetical protein
MFLVVILKWFLVYLRLFCGIMGWKRAEQWVGKVAKDEPDLSFEKHVL